MISRILVGVGAVAIGVGVAFATRVKSPLARVTKRLIALSKERNKAEAAWLKAAQAETKACIAELANWNEQSKAVVQKATAACEAAWVELQRLEAALLMVAREKVALENEAVARQPQLQFEHHDLSCNIWHAAAKNAPCTCCN